MTNVTIPDKSTADTLTAEEFNQILDAIKDGTRTVNAEAIQIAGNALTFSTGLTDTNSTITADAAEGTAVLSTGESGGTKFLREDGDNSCSWQVPAGSGDVSKVGTPVNDQVGIWTGDGTIEGSANLTFDGNSLTIGTNLVVGGTVDGIDIATDVAANTAKVSYPGSADATELNILDGATLTTTELNYVDGVTSALQTQMDTKMADLVDDTSPDLGGELDAGAHSIGFTLQSATGDGTTTIDWKLGNKFKFTFGAQNDTFTFTAPTNPCAIQIILVQDGTGSRTATWPAAVKWPSGTAPTLTTTATTGTDIISFVYDGTNYYGTSSADFS